jgi:hypothetical protein
VIRAAGETEVPRIREVSIGELDRRLQCFRLPGERAIRGSLANGLGVPGGLPPLWASDAVQAGVLVLWDGFKRLAWLLAQGTERASVAVLSLSRAEALTAMARAHAGRRGLTALEEAWIVKGLHQDEGLEQTEIAARLGRHKSWVCRRLALTTRLEEKVQDDVRLGLIPPSTAREIVRLPRGNQAQAAEAICRHGLSARESRGLVGVLRQARPEERRAILEDPRPKLFPAPRPSGPARSAGPAPDPRLGRSANRIRAEILNIHGAVLRLEALLLAAASLPLDPEEQRLVATLSDPVREKVSAVLSGIGEVQQSRPEVLHVR